MSMTSITRSALAAVLLAGVALAQVQEGAVAPAFEFEKVFNGGPATFGDLDGRVAILDFSATW